MVHARASGPDRCHHPLQRRAQPRRAQARARDRRWELGHSQALAAHPADGDPARRSAWWRQVCLQTSSRWSSGIVTLPRRSSPHGKCEWSNSPGDSPRDVRSQPTQESNGSRWSWAATRRLSFSTMPTSAGRWSPASRAPSGQPGRTASALENPGPPPRIRRIPRRLRFRHESPHPREPGRRAHRRRTNDQR